MSQVNHQTVQLKAGRHRSPEEGACVMELASMLAGERFSDSPATACPVIATFLRSYNDLVSDDERQVLLVCASRVVGSRRPELEAARAHRLREVAIELFDEWPAWRRRCAIGCGWRAVLTTPERPDDRSAWKVTAWAAASLLRRLPDGGRRAVALVDELVAMGETPVVEPVASPEAPVTAG